eukprot:TRINITY_DN1353_c0_g1_i1.p1 TRINITY_DN1353_c0_g1~~TRINITY_DN1353_c0_g1_i1.p1  ORF type:complete len:1171 (+),score=123.77 TRINITY_DN1353_c0_g1_i1:444-3956(+)
MIALDSVTPVAKMVQQRSRRIRGVNTISSLAELAKHQNEKELFDISAISPGTEFMTEMNKQINFFLMSKIDEDPLYQRVRVILSDSNTPGEGEHKIMDFLRRYKASSEYDPNTRYCIYGPDADLIMLALVSHEPHTIIIRDVTDSHSRRDTNTISIPRPNILKLQEYEIVYISMLREYFEQEYRCLESLLKFPYSLERIIDDFVFFSFFVGNDFLPYLNTVDINYGSLDLLIRIYKEALPKLKGYITDNGKIIWENAEVVFTELGKSEFKVFQERLGIVEKEKPKNDPPSEPEEPGKAVLKAEPAIPVTPEVIEAEKESPEEEEENKRAPYTDPSLEISWQFDLKMCELYQKDVNEAKKLYYSEKLHIDISTEDGKKALAKIISKYLEGLQWVLYYYYKGVPHWGWYYPYHYAPLISDISSIKDYIDPAKTVFDLKEPNNPLTPFEQLLCILPKASMALLPKRYHKLYDEDSEIRDLYPEKYQIDYNGRELPWEAIKLIPFVDIFRVLEAEGKMLADPTLPPLTEFEKERNVFHKPVEYLYSKVPPATIIDSTLKEMPKLINPHCIKREYVFPTGPTSFSSTLAKGVDIPCYDFPSLKHIGIIGCEVQTVNSRNGEYDRVDLILPDCPVPEEDLSSLLGKIVYVDYPYQKEARIMSIATKTLTISQQFNAEKGCMELTKNEVKDSKFITDAFYTLKRQGLKTADGEIKFVCYCAPMEYIMKNFQGTEPYSKSFSYKSWPYASPVVMLTRDPRNYLNCDKWLLDQELQYPAGASCAIIRGKDYGSVGVISDSTTKSQIKVQLNTTVNKKALDSLWDTCKAFEGAAAASKVVFLPLAQVAKKLSISRFAMKKMISSVKIKVSSGNIEKKFNVALSLINFMQKVHVPYHFIYDVKARDWAISAEVVQCLEEYIKRYPTLFQVLDVAEGDKTMSGTFKSSIIFPNESDPDQATKDLFAWVLSLPISQLPYVPMGATMINPTLYTQLKSKVSVESDVQPLTLLTTKDPLEILVERDPFWIRPSSAKAVGDFKPGDRVVCIKTSGLSYVPFGCSGTIIGIQGRKALVDFDQQMITGTSFGGQCGKSQGRVVDAYSLINLFGYGFKLIHENRGRRKPKERKKVGAEGNGKAEQKHEEKKSQAPSETPLPPAPPKNPQKLLAIIYHTHTKRACPHSQT